MNKIDFPQWLKEKRDVERMSLRELAERLPFSHGTLHNLETGRILPNSEHVRAIAGVFRINEVELLSQFGLVSVNDKNSLIKKLDSLSPSERLEVERFVDYVRTKRGRDVDKPKVTINRETAPVREAAL